MSDRYGNGVHTSLWSAYDVAPEEDRGRYFQGTPVDMLTFHDNPQSGMELEYQEVFISRPPGELFYEPTDETVSTNDRAAESRSIPFATDSRYYSEAERLKTFDSRWLEDYNVKPKDLARDGFIHIGPGDKVKCVFCLKTLRGWEVGDSVEREHRKHYPFCPFVKGECDGLNIPLNATESMKRSFGLKIKPAGQHTAPAMQDFSQRLRSFDTWPRQAHIRPDALAEAGLYYSGTSDKVLCFSCGKALANWEPGDDPWYEHAKWSPDCPHVHSVKGSEYVKQIQEEDREHLTNMKQEEDREHLTNMKQEEDREHLTNMKQETSAGQESSVVPMSTEVNQAASASGTTRERDEVKVNQSDLKPQTVSHSTKKSGTEIEQVINSAPVKAILETYDIPIDKMRELLTAIKITGDDTFKRNSVRDLLEAYNIDVDLMREMLARVQITEDFVLVSKNCTWSERVEDNARRFFDNLLSRHGRESAHELLRAVEDCMIGKALDDDAHGQ